MIDAPTSQTTDPAQEVGKAADDLVQHMAKATIALFQTPEWKRFMEAVNNVR